MGSQGWYDLHQETEKLMDQEWLQDLLDTDLYETTTRCLYGSKNLGIMKMPQSIMEGLIDKFKENASKIVPISLNLSPCNRTNWNLNRNYILFVSRALIIRKGKVL